MKVLQINPYPPEHLGGSEIFCKNLAINLKKYKKIQSEILTSDIFKERIKIRFIEESIKVYYQKFYFNFWGKNPVVNIHPFIKKIYQKYDILHAHSYIFFSSLQSAYLRKVRKFPLVLHIHGGVQTPLDVSSSISEYFQLIWKGFFFDKIFGKFTIENSDAIISVSKRDLDLLNYKYDLSDIAKYHIPNAVDITKFKKDANSIPEYITFIGRLSYIKGFDIFIKLIQELYNRNKELKFLIIGKGPLYHLLTKIDSTIPIIYYESFPYDDIQKIYNLSKLLVLTSRFEGIPTSILESLACETPVIAPNVGGISEILNPRVNGLLYDLNQYEKIIDTILNLLSDKEKCNKFGREGRKDIERNFSWQKVTNDIEKVYLELLK